jgi:hypothetical protein
LIYPAINPDLPLVSLLISGFDKLDLSKILSPCIEKGEKY